MTDVKVVFEITDEKMDELDWEQMETILDGNIVRSRSIVALFVIDEDGQTVPHEIAMQMLGKLKRKEIAQVVTDFTKALKDSAVNPTKGASSSSYSRAAKKPPVGSKRSTRPRHGGQRPGKSVENE